MRTCPTCQRSLPESRFNDRWPDCFRCRVQSQRLQPSAAPTSADPNLFKQLREERHLTEDGDAYKRLRADGFQPKSINGSAHLEANASTKFEIESGRVFSDQRLGKEALSFFQDTFGREATTPAATPINQAGDAA